jgi:hypothetical protein
LHDTFFLISIYTKSTTPIPVYPLIGWTRLTWIFLENPNSLNG